MYGESAVECGIVSRVREPFLLVHTLHELLEKTDRLRNLSGFGQLLALIE